MDELPVVEENAPLAPLTTFGVAQQAQRLVTVHNEAALISALGTAHNEGSALAVLGGGSNLLLRGNVAGTLLHMRIGGIEVLERREKGYVRLRVGGGENWHGLVMHCVANGYQGIENLALIPGTVGACPIQNIGAYGVEVESAIEQVEGYTFAGEKLVLAREQCAFGYRMSIFKDPMWAHFGRFVISHVLFRLSLSPYYGLKTGYGEVATALAELPRSAPDVQDVAEVVCAIRRRKLPDWRELGNAGSFFKNPVVKTSTPQIAELLANNPAMPQWPAGEGLVKLSAAWLIEQAGMKGYRLGPAGVFARHALVLVNYGGATGADVWAVAEIVMAAVQARFGIALQAEVNLW